MQTEFPGIEEMEFFTNTKVSRVVKQGEVITAEAPTTLEQGDMIREVGTEEDLKRLTYLVGRETDEAIPLIGRTAVRKFLVTSKDVINKPLQQFGLLHNYNATVYPFALVLLIIVSQLLGSL